MNCQELVVVVAIQLTASAALQLQRHRAISQVLCRTEKVAPLLMRTTCDARETRQLVFAPAVAASEHRTAARAFRVFEELITLQAAWSMPTEQ